MVLGVLSFVCGLILDTIASLNRKQYELELNKKIEQIEQVGE